MADNRTVLFLYPDFETYNTEDQNLITKLISDLKLIINASNTKIGKILQDGSFSYIRCLPFIEMEDATKKPSDDLVDLVRVCVIGYNDKNYENIYSDICDDYEKNKLDITHLVGLKINSSLETIKFIKPNNSSFDVVIETNLSNLELILISIMLDTSIYHYFSLNNDIKYRKSFSKLKIQGIKELNYIEDYGKDTDFSKIDYLPFSYPYVKRYFKSHGENKNEVCKKVTDDLIKDFFSFIISCVCIMFEYNNRKEPINPYIKDINQNVKNVLNKTIKDDKFKLGNTYIVAIDSNINESSKIIINENVFMLECNDLEVALKEWLSLFCESLTDFLLFQIKIGD